MDYKIEYPADNTAVIRITVSKDDWAKDIEQAKEATKQDDEQVLRQYAISAVGSQALADAIQKDNLRLADAPAILADDDENGDVEITLTCNLLPEVKLGQYKGFGVKGEPVVVTDEEVMEEINRRINAEKLWNTVDKPAENGDRVMINFIGEKDGVPFEGGSAENYGLVLGSGTFIPGFEEQLIGTKAGETKDVDVTFPETYFEPSLAGQPVVFHVTINAVQQEIKPELSDEFLQKIGIEGVKTVEQFKEQVNQEMLAMKGEEAENKLLGEIMNKIISEAKVDIPEVMVNNQIDQLVEQYQANLQQYGMTLDQYLQMINSSMDEFRNILKPQAEADIRAALVLEAIATEENIQAEDKEIDEEYALLSKVYNFPAEQIKALIPEGAVTTQIIQKKTLDFLKDQNQAK